MTEQNGATRVDSLAAQHPLDPPPELHCHATTRAGQPCRNRPLEGQQYCRIHAPLNGANSAAPSQVVTLVGSSEAEEIAIGAQAEEHSVGTVATDDSGRNQAVETMQELEVEVRNRDTEPTATRDLAAEALRLIRENLARMTPQAGKEAIKLIRENLSSDYLDPDFWRGIGMVLRYQAEETANLIQRRLRGEYTTDAYGMDEELIEIVRPFFAFLYRTWWRVSVEGLEHVPGEGRALLIANHSGVLPWDGAMIATAVLEEHSQPRVVRTLYPSIATNLPGLAPALKAFGQVQESTENAARLLEDDQLVCVFPEGLKGLGKLFKERYKLQRFRRGASVGPALSTGAPIIPVAVVGAEEAYPMLADASPLAHLFRLPYFPLTPLFPWLGIVGLIPLPSKWAISFGEPIPTAEYGPGAADDPLLISRLNDQVREQIQMAIDGLRTARKSAFSR